MKKQPQYKVIRCQCGQRVYPNFNRNDVAVCKCGNIYAKDQLERAR